MSFGFGFALTAIAKAVGFTPRSLFTSGAQGAWYDPSDFSTMFEDAAGTIPITSPLEKPVGLMLDKSKGLVLGPELVTNANTATSWVVGGTNTATQDGSAVKVTYVDNNIGGLVFLNNGPLSGNLTAGKRYKVTFEAKVSSSGAVNIAVTDGASVVGTYTYALTSDYQAFTTHITYLSGTPYLGRVTDGSLGAGESYWVRNISVKEVTGNHATQSTTTSRPTLSARYNLLTKTEQFDDAAWTKAGTTVTANAVTAPDGTLSADKLVEDSTTAEHRAYFGQVGIGTVSMKWSVYAKAAERSWIALRSDGGTRVANFDLTNGVVGITTGVTATISSVGGGWYLCAMTSTTSAVNERYVINIGNADTGTGIGYSYAGTSGSGIYIWGADLRVANDGVNLPSYQRVNTATDYDYAGFPPYLKFDGVDDSFVTNSIDFTGTDKMSVFAGARRLSSSIGIITELSFSATNIGAFYLANDVVANYYRMFVTGSDSNYLNSVSVSAPPTTHVLSGGISITPANITLRVNGGNVTTSSSTLGSGNFGAYPLYIGRRGGSSLPFNGRIYSLVVVGKLASAAEIASTEKWVNQKTRAFA